MKSIDFQHKMLAFIQPYSLEYAGGGSRILRSLLEASPYPYVSICCGPLAPNPVKFAQEIHIPVRPTIKRLEHSRFCKYLGGILPLTASQHKRKLSSYLRSIHATGIHAIPQGIDFGYAFDVAQELKIPYYLNVHDELTYNLPNFIELPQCLEYLEKVWKGSTKRFVISEKMGEEYCRRYGDREYLVITDGIKSIPKLSKSIIQNRFNVYFMGSIHISYEKNFTQLIHGLNQLKKLNPSLEISLIIRGSISFPIPDTNLPIHLLGWGSQDEVMQDMENADFLYLPLPFGTEYDSFTRFSMSTKLVSYLGSALPILYHGPQYAAAATLLSEGQSAVVIDTLDPMKIAQTILIEQLNRDQIVDSALRLAQEKFYLPEIQKKFWDSFSLSENHRELVQISS
jgi:glycosyltransferase involved in cell wall biosynthesis